MLQQLSNTIRNAAITNDDCNVQEQQQPSATPSNSAQLCSTQLSSAWFSSVHSCSRRGGTVAMAARAARALCVPTQRHTHICMQCKWSVYVYVCVRPWRNSSGWNAINFGRMSCAMVGINLLPFARLWQKQKIQLHVHTHTHIHLYMWLHQAVWKVYVSASAYICGKLVLFGALLHSVKPLYLYTYTQALSNVCMWPFSVTYG